MYTLRVCSLLVIPPPIGRTVPQGGFSTDLTELNLLGWADLVQDVAVGLQVLPPRLCLDLGTQAIALLQLLEAATRVGFCHHCCQDMLYMYGSLSASFPHVMEPDCSADPGIRSDLHFQRSNRSEYSRGRYAWICGASSRPHPSRFLHLEHTPSGGLPASPLYWPPVGRATLLRATIDRQAQAMRATVPQAPPLQVPQVVPPMHQPLPSSRSQPATPYQQAVQLPIKPKGRGVSFNSSANKLVVVGGQDADGHGRQRTHDRDDKTRPTSSGKGVHKRSSVRMTGKQMPRQVSERPSGAPCEALRDSTPGSTLHQCSSSTRAPMDPLRHVARFRSQGWRKDLDLIFKVYYKYNFSSFKESEWSRIRDKVLDHLLPLQEEWRGIKENDPLQYMPYIKEQFFAATRIQLKGLAECTTWIKRGSYYHSVVARKGQLHKCPHLVGIEPPEGPQITPSESRLVSQRKLETPASSSSAPAIEASTPQGATTDVPAPMETGAAGDGQSWAEQTEDEDNFKRCRPMKCPWSQSRR